MILSYDNVRLHYRHTCTEMVPIYSMIQKVKYNPGYAYTDIDLPRCDGLSVSQNAYLILNLLASIVS